MRHTYLIVFSILIIWLSACKSNPKTEELTAATIAGKWTIISAMRDTNSTEMLNNAYIDFKSDQVFTSLPLTEDSIAHSSFTFVSDSMNCPDFNTSFKFKKNHDTLNVTFYTAGHQFSANMLKK